jgi:hypothetical protein
VKLCTKTEIFLHFHGADSRYETPSFVLLLAIFATNSTGKLAFLDGMIGVGQAEVDAAGNTDITSWEFETGIL